MFEAIAIMPNEFETDPRFADLGPPGHHADEGAYSMFLEDHEDDGPENEWPSPEDYDAIRDEASYDPDLDPDYLPEPPAWIGAEGGVL